MVRLDGFWNDGNEAGMDLMEWELVVRYVDSEGRSCGILWWVGIGFDRVEGSFVPMASLNYDNDDEDIEVKEFPRQEGLLFGGHVNIKGRFCRYLEADGELGLRREATV